MAKKSGIQFDDSLFQHKLKKLVKATKTDEKEFIRQQSGLYLRDIAKFTPPYANFPTGRGTKVGTKKDEVAGNTALLHDLNKIFFVPDDKNVYYRARDRFPGQVYKGNRIIGAGVARGIDDMARHHRKHQSKRTGRTYSLKGPEMMWTSADLLKKYFRRESKNVGKAKASVLTAAIKFDPKRIADAPKWVARHLGIGGHGKLVKLKGWNGVFNIKAFGLQHVMRGDIVRRVTKARMKAMEKSLLAIMKHNTKKAGFK